MNADWRNRYEVALDAAHDAGRFALQYFDQGIAIEWKADHSPVTMADRGAKPGGHRSIDIAANGQVLAVGHGR